VQSTYDSGGDTGTLSPTTDGGSDGSADDEASTSSQTYLRIAHVSPDMPPIDVCVALHGTGSFQGPLIGQLVAATAGDAREDADTDTVEGGAAAPGVAYSQLSAYLALGPGQYDVRIVSGGASSCSPLLDAGVDGAAGVPDSTNLPALAVDACTTLIVAGEISPVGTDQGVAVVMLPDDAVLAGGAASLRAINAMPSEPSLDLGLGSATMWLPLLTDVRFGAASTRANPDDGALDSNGYISIAPLSAQAMSVRPSSSDAATDTASASSVTVPLGSIVTTIAIGGKTGDSAHPPALLLCTDNQPSGGILADCSIAQ
jgi:hypothetical protein